MKNILHITALILLLAFASCSDKISYSEKKIYQNKFKDAVPVLNIATFHMCVSQ